MKYLLIATLVLSQAMFAQKAVKPAVYDKLNTAHTAEVTGPVGDKFAASYNNRILAQDIDKLIHPFTVHDEHSCWQGEFWGKWFTSAALAYHYQPTSELMSTLTKAAKGLIATQTAEGYIGNYAPESHLQAWDIWGRKYSLLGLLAYYDITKDKATLEAAKKEADFLIKELDEKNANIVTMGNHRGMAASSVLEPITQLYVRTGDKRYLDFAEEIVHQWETPEGPQLISKSTVPVGQRFPKPDTSWYGWEQGQKAYEMMSCYEGLIELYRITGKEEYKRGAENTWQSIVDTEINIAGSGAAMEAWFGGKALQAIPINHFQETCVTVTWIKLSQQLLRLTGEVKYADAIETAFYNALLGAMRPDGADWAKYTPLSGQRLPGSEQCGMGLNCCNASGPRGLFTIPLTAVMSSEEGASVNFYIAGTYGLKTPKGNTLTVKQRTDYPVSGDVNIALNLKKPEKITIALRIPQWSENSSVTVNGETVKNIRSGDYLKITREWKDNDTISISFDMRGKVHSIGEKPEYKAITRGPVVLTRDERLQGPGLEAVLAPITDNNGFIDLTPKKRNDHDIWMVFSAKLRPEAYTEYGAEPVEVEFCDYASAGNTVTTYPFFKVWLPQLFDPRD
jgi:Uncharacterized protein conserved in bacteria